MVSTPSFDPNAFNEGLSGKAWHRLINNPDTPLTNKAIAGQYAPGSTFKMVVALAALELNISPSIRATCYGHMQLGNQKFHCWKKGGHGSVDMIESIKGSCDIYFYELAKKVGVDRIAAMARRLGLGSTLDLDIPGERAGLIPTKAWKQATIGIPWQLGETLVAGIGQGYVLATPLQLAVMTARLVNGGFAVKPRLTLAPPGVDPADEPPREFKSIGLSDYRGRRIVIQGMDEVVNNPQGGTAWRSRIQDKKNSRWAARQGRRRYDGFPWRSATVEFGRTTSGRGGSAITRLFVGLRAYGIAALCGFRRWSSMAVAGPRRRRRLPRTFCWKRSGGSRRRPTARDRSQMPSARRRQAKSAAMRILPRPGGLPDYEMSEMTFRQRLWQINWSLIFLIMP